MTTPRRSSVIVLPVTPAEKAAIVRAARPSKLTKWGRAALLTAAADAGEIPIEKPTAEVAD